MSAATSPADATAGARRRACVLVVDDEEDIRDTLREAIEMIGCTAITAANGWDALEILAKQRPCLIVLDLIMPVMTGQELIEAMRNEPAYAKVPVLVSTSAPQHAPPGVPVLPKPINLQALWSWLRRNCACEEHQLLE